MCFRAGLRRFSKAHTILAIILFIIGVNIWMHFKSPNIRSTKTVKNGTLVINNSFKTKVLAEEQQNMNSSFAKELPSVSNTDLDKQSLLKHFTPGEHHPENNSTKDLRESKNQKLTNGDVSSTTTSHTANKKSFTVFTNSTKLLGESTIWPQIGCIKPHCDTQTLAPLMPNTSYLSAMEYNLKETCSSPKGNEIIADKSPTNLEDLISKIDCDAGGRWRPKDCKPKQKVAVMVPFRNRTSMLGTWLRHIHWFLQQQKLDYAIYIVEQDNNALFNRAALLNIAAKFAMQTADYNCLINHDIDQLPVNLQNSYTCHKDPLKVTHHARHVPCKHPQPYRHHFGLVSSLTPSQFLSVNGYSNLYFGWGSEDDDMSMRLRKKGHSIHLRKDVGFYECLSHEKAKKKKDRRKWYRTATQRYNFEGYNTMVYDLLAYSETPLFTWIYVHIDKKKIHSHFEKIKNQM